MNESITTGWVRDTLAQSWCDHPKVGLAGSCKECRDRADGFLKLYRRALRKEATDD